MARTDARGITLYGSTIDNRCFYERLVKLEDGSLLAVWMRNFPIVTEWTGMRSFYFYKSVDNGKTWKQISVLDTAAFGFMREKQGMPGLFVFPEKLGIFPAGTIIFATTDWDKASEYTIHIFRSTDGGLSWDFHTSLAKRSSRNTWEPEFAISADGKLVCYYSDERQPGYDQCLALEVSEDGGISWGGYKIIVGKEVPGWTPGVDPVQWRPGMPRVLRFKNGQYFMAYENIGYDPNGIITWIGSPNGLDWGEPGIVGSPVTVNGFAAYQCPEIALLDDGTANGRLFVRGMNDTCSPSLCFSSIDSGNTWELFEAPLTAVRNEGVGSGWSGTLLADGVFLYELNNHFNGNFNEIRFGTGQIFGRRMIVSTANYRVKNNASGYFLDDPDGISVPGTRLVQSPENSLFTQSYHCCHVDDMLYTIRCNHNNLQVDAESANNYPVVLNSIAADKSRQWNILSMNNDLVKLQNADIGYLMDTLGQSVDEGKEIICAQENSGRTQAWNMERVFHVACFESFNIPKRFIRHLSDNTVIIDTNFTSLPLEDSQWIIRPGLADRFCISFESENFPGFYLRHFEGKIYIAELEETAIFRSDATFRIRPGLADNAFISLETFNFDGIYMRHRDGIVIISDIVSDLDRADATFKEIKQ
jgi:hypothetical protein